MEPFAVVCDEPGGRVSRVVKTMTTDPRQVLVVYDSLKLVTNYLAKEKQLEPTALISLLDPRFLHLLVDDVGIIAVYPELPHPAAHVHITFWDKRLRGREELCRETARRVMQTLSLKYLWTAIPDGARATAAFARRVGFIEFTELSDTKGFILPAEGIT